MQTADFARGALQPSASTSIAARHTNLPARCAMHPLRRPAASLQQTVKAAHSTTGGFCATSCLKQAGCKEGSRQHRNTRHLCRARRKRSSADVEEVEDKDEEEEEDEVSSRRPNNPSDEDDEEEEDDLGDAAISDPTTRLFQMVKNRDYDDEEVDLDDEEDDGIGLPAIDKNDELSRRGRKRKSLYSRANEDMPLPGVDDEDTGLDAPDIDPLEDIDPDEDIDLDEIMGDTFDDVEDVELEDELEDGLEDGLEEEQPMPSRATQHRPTAAPDEVAAPTVSEEAEEEEEEEDDLGPLLEYPDPPDRSYRLGDLLEMCSYEIPETGVRDVEVSGIQHRAAEVKEGDLYVCTSSVLYDGYMFVDRAVENGAVAVVSDRELEADLEVPVIVVPNTDEAVTRLAVAFYNFPSRKMLVVGITGSRGKTTTSWLVRGIFEEMQRVTGMIGSIEYAIAVDKMTADGNLWEPAEEDTTLQRDCSTAFHLSPYRGKYEPPASTPDSLGVQKVMAGMADRGATACVYEADIDAVGSGWSAGVDLDVAVYMGLTQEDLEREGPEKLLEDQVRLFASLTDPLRQTAVVNIDDPYAEFIIDFAKAVPSVTFSVTSRDADVYVDRVNYNLWETELVISTPAGKLNLASTLIGRHNVPNILAAVAVGLAITIDGDGIPIKAIVQGIEATEIIPGRCEVIDEDQDFGVVIDSADTPESLSRLLDSIREIGSKRIILVFGCEGERDKHIRPFMGEIAHYKADIVILTNDNPRGERPSHIIADIAAGYPDDVLEHNAMQPYSPGFLQDPGYIPVEALEFSWHNSYEYRRYVMEDRWTALRWAIGTAQKKDCVVIAGKGHEDFQEWDLGEGLVKGWFDDRVECRNALSKVSRLARHDNDLDRKELPWMEPEERLDNLRVYNIDAD